MGSQHALTVDYVRPLRFGVRNPCERGRSADRSGRRRDRKLLWRKIDQPFRRRALRRMQRRADWATRLRAIRNLKARRPLQSRG